MDGIERGRMGFRVTGRVQGVGFRWWTRGVARELGLRGSVRNCPDGSVEIHAAGDGMALALFEQRLHRGPTGARVDAVRPVTAKPDLPEGDFVIDG